MSEKMNIIDKLHQEFVIERIKNLYEKKGKEGPLVVELDTTEVCNLKCPGCISEDLVENSTSFSSERLLEIAKEFVEIGVKAVILIGGGEPLAHPAVGKLISYLGENDVSIGITTNGCFIDRYMEPISQYADWTRVSMDAATQDTFDKLRPSKDGKSKFNHIINNMRKLASIKKGILGFSYLIRTEKDGFGIQSNIHEIYDAAILAKDIGCDYFEVKPSYNYVGGQPHALVIHDKERMKEARKEIEKLDKLEDENFRIIKAINLESSLRCVDDEQEKKYHRCPMGDLRTLVTPSGVYVCPYWRGKDKFRIGNAHRESMSNIWKGEQRKNVMDYVDPSKVCNFHCLRHESNIEVFKIISSKPEETKIIKEYDRFI